MPIIDQDFASRGPEKTSGCAVTRFEKNRAGIRTSELPETLSGAYFAVSTQFTVTRAGVFAPTDRLPRRLPIIRMCE